MLNYYIEIKLQLFIVIYTLFILEKVIELIGD
jgi:hypothetical protein